jgi:hypothetical protein
VPFLGPDEIPGELFSQHLAPADVLAVLAEDPLALDEAVAVLRHFGLVRADEQMLTLDRLLEQVVRDGLDPAGKPSSWGVVVRLLAGCCRSAAMPIRDSGRCA